MSVMSVPACPSMASSNGVGGASSSAAVPTPAAVLDVALDRLAQVGHESSRSASLDIATPDPPPFLPAVPDTHTSGVGQAAEPGV